MSPPPHPCLPIVSVIDTHAVCTLVPASQTPQQESKLHYIGQTLCTCEGGCLLPISMDWGRDVCTFWSWTSCGLWALQMGAGSVGSQDISLDGRASPPLIPPSPFASSDVNGNSNYGASNQSHCNLHTQT